MPYKQAKRVLLAAADMKLALNGHKGLIHTLNPHKAALLAKGELTEVINAMKDGDWEKVIVECGDVTNFLIAITEISMQQYRKRKS